MEWKQKYPSGEKFVNGKHARPGEKGLLEFFSPQIRELFITFDLEMQKRFGVKNRFGAEHRFLETKGWIYGYGRDYGIKLIDMTIENHSFVIAGIAVIDKETMEIALDKAKKKYDDGYEERFAAKSEKAKKGQSGRAQKQAENKTTITNETVIGFGKPTSAEAQRFFKKTLGAEYEKFKGDLWYTNLWAKHSGKTMGQLVAECVDGSIQNHTIKSLQELLQEERYSIVSNADKDFIISYDQFMSDMGYDFGGAIAAGIDDGTFAIQYKKSEGKNKSPFSRVHINKDGSLRLRLYFSDIEKHQKYIESSPAHIKSAFAFDEGNCLILNTGEPCVKGCKGMKRYTIDGVDYVKCHHSIAHFRNPTVDRLPDYIALLSQFYPNARGYSQSN